MNDTKTDSETTVTEVCVLCARAMLESQLPKIKDKGYDFAPQFRQMTIQLYVVGVMWRQGESLDLPTNARDHAFMALESMLISDGMKKKEAQKRVAFLSKMSKVEGGDDSLPVSMGYQAMLDDDSIVAVFDEYRNETRVSGSLWRLYERGKKIMVVGGAVAAFLTIWFVTIFIPKTEGIDVLAVGLLAAALVVLPTFLVGLLIYRLKIRKRDSSGARQS